MLAIVIVVGFRRQFTNWGRLDSLVRRCSVQNSDQLHVYRSAVSKNVALYASDLPTLIEMAQ
jgi:hypothetical protein